ncbi:hypothetical protein CRE_25863 [Caenorhabditis remanei]|uniref:Uncharacterized protein n=1 Tax=Caenorhabditis remanei TaxID=31234 RepID=E3NDS4_CAERE|nr:hypothetical protein CRE_25863 [Caenorhabditis remanei]
MQPSINTTGSRLRRGEQYAEKIRKLGTYAYDDIEAASRDRLMATQFFHLQSSLALSTTSFN